MCRLSGGWRIEVAEDCCVKSSNCAYYGCLVRMTACLLPWAVQFPSRWTDTSQRIRRHGNCGGRQSNSVPARPGFIKLSNLSIAVAPNLTRTAFLFFLPPPHNNFNVAFCRQSVNSSRFQEIPPDKRLETRPQPCCNCSCETIKIPHGTVHPMRCQVTEIRVQLLSPLLAGWVESTLYPGLQHRRWQNRAIYIWLKRADGGGGGACNWRSTAKQVENCHSIKLEIGKFDFIGSTFHPRPLRSSNSGMDEDIVVL